MYLFLPHPLDINWGSSTQAFLYSYSMRNLLKLEKLEEHVKNFRFVTGANRYVMIKALSLVLKCCLMVFLTQ